ncbi:unannotated protein [freshwater metagenome]|uniref:Unannotated protein n=1 Tax=freshwater metagenome TaxID=449393 RepID=A0A6J7VW35_9ZZZZ
MGLGTSPVRIILFRLAETWGFGTGTADIKAWVYGCAGAP